METINIIPSNYEGNPHDALGYAWEDVAHKIPGEDIVLMCDPEKGIPWKKYLRDRYGGDVEIHSHNYGWLMDTPGGKIVARINCMWCGGVSGVVYRPDHDTTRKPESPDNCQTGDSLAETAATVKMAENIDTMEMDEFYGAHPGYCARCHSFCYGDCDAQIQ